LLPENGNVVATAVAVAPGSARFVQQAMVEPGHRRRVRMRLRQQHLHRDGVLGPEPRADALQHHRAARGRPAGASNTSDSATSATTRTAVRAPHAFARAQSLQRARIGARELECRQRHAAGQHRREQREEENALIDPDGMQAGNLDRADADQRVDAPQGDDGAAGAAERREDEPLAQELANDPAAARAERGANRDLAPPGGAAREQQVRHVGARDEQHRRHRREQHDEPEPVVADEHVLKPAHDHAARAAARVRLVDVRGDGGQLGLRGRKLDAGFEMAERLQERGAALVGKLRREPRRHDRHPDVDRVFGVERKLEAGRHHPDDRDQVAVEPDGAADQFRVARKLPAPEAFGDERGPLRASRIVAGAEQAALHR
jgi:hypothetical protein